MVDTSGDLSQVVAETDEEGNLTASYVRGHELISIEKPNNKWYYICDGRGSVRHLLNEEGTATDNYSYDAYGVLLTKDGETDNSYMYVGEEYNANTGLYYLRARYMNPTTGSFTTMDSYQGNLYDPISLHKYAYANANPVSYTDPSGYSPLPTLAIGMSISQIISASMPFIKVSTLIGAASGALIGGIDTFLGGGDFGDILKDALIGLGVGAGFGALLSTLMCFAILYPIALVALQTFQVVLFVYGSIGVLVSIEEGNTLQAIFRAVLNLISLKFIKGSRKMIAEASKGGTTSNSRYIPMDADGNPIPLNKQRVNGQDIPLPDPDAQGRPHTVLGSKISSKTGEIYLQSATFPDGTYPSVNGYDVPWSEVHWTNHGTPQHHANPHQHIFIYNPDKGGWIRTEPTPYYPKGE